jgi:copper homeostasis protein
VKRVDPSAHSPVHESTNSPIDKATNSPILLEVIVQTVDDARAAEDGGADRLEVVRRVDVGGLTPDLAIVEAIKSTTSLPLRIMLRENGGFETTPEEIDRMRATAAELAAMKVDGLVCGFAHDGRLSLDEFDAAVAPGSPLAVTFHRAFDSLVNPETAIDVLSRHQVIDRILTSGGDGSIEQRCARLGRFVARAGPRLTIIAGGGVDLEMVRRLVEERTVREIHVGRTAREGLNAGGPVSAASVRRLRDLADSHAG